MTLKTKKRTYDEDQVYYDGANIALSADSKTAKEALISAEWPTWEKVMYKKHESLKQLMTRSLKSQSYSKYY